MTGSRSVFVENSIYIFENGSNLLIYQVYIIGFEGKKSNQIKDTGKLA